MTRIVWDNGAGVDSTDYRIGANWAGGVVPGGEDVAVIPRHGVRDPYVVISPVDETVGALQVGEGASFFVDGGTFRDRNRSGESVNNGGTLSVGFFNAGPTTLIIGGGAFENTGLMGIRSFQSGISATLKLDGNTTLSGGGVVSIGQRPYSFYPLLGKNVIKAINSSIVLTNLDNTIIGTGDVGHGEMTLINGAAGSLIADGGADGGRMTINTGANTIINAGVIEAYDKGRAVFKSPVYNTGQIIVSNEDFAPDEYGIIRFEAAVSGSGSAIIHQRTLDFESSFNENVSFTGDGKLVLAQSQSYTAAVSGFSSQGRDQLDLRDIGFVGPDEATFSGTATSGVLTVTDGAHVAHVNLIGDYRASTFAAASDNHGGVLVTKAVTGGAATRAPHQLITAMAALASEGSETRHPSCQPVHTLMTLMSYPRICDA